VAGGGNESRSDSRPGCRTTKVETQRTREHFAASTLPPVTHYVVVLLSATKDKLVLVGRITQTEMEARRKRARRREPGLQ